MIILSYDKDKVKEQIELDDVFNLLDYFGAEPQMYTDYIICRTVCHNGISPGNDASMKLYYYEKTRLFHCYTHCGSFDIFELVQKVKNIEDLNTAVYFVVNFFNLQSQLDDEVDISDDNLEDWRIFRLYQEQKDIKINDNDIELPECDLSVIKYYPQLIINSWIKDNISKDVCDFANVRYDPLCGNILIPHFDINNRCVGIRQRTIIEEKEQYGKYKPWRNNGILYNHPLAFNLYGLNWAKDRIQEMQTAIVVESEKAALAYMTYFGTGNSICVATCGSSLSKYQFKLLKDCGCKEIVIAYDHDFKEYGTEESKRVEEKIAKIGNKYKSYMNISVLFDRENILNYKASPLDQGKDVFLYLFKNRIVL
ncbi:MAG TPA: hypothetical protein DD621_04995 [Clostridiales bacterium]|nr:hypothetical protein [Clostridiales bacterium]